MMISQSVLGD